MLEHVFAELGHATLGPEDFLELQAEHFATLCRIKTVEKELPASFEMVRNNVEKTWARYLGYAFIAVFFLAYSFSCIYMSQMEEIASEVKRQRYVRT